MYLWYPQFLKHAVVQYSYCNRGRKYSLWNVNFSSLRLSPLFSSLSTLFRFLVSLSCTIHCSSCYTVSSPLVYLLSLSSSLSFSKSFFSFALNLFFSLSSFFSQHAFLCSTSLLIFLTCSLSNFSLLLLFSCYTFVLFRLVFCRQYSEESIDVA